MAELKQIDELIERIDWLLTGANGLGGQRGLSDYGQGQYDMADRILRKLREITTSQKASEDASVEEN